MKPLTLALLALLVQAQSTFDSNVAASLEGRVSFLASNLLEGRDTPSRGLEIAADYIESEFHRAGLQAAPEASQLAHYIQVRPSPIPPRFSMTGIRPISPDRIAVSGTRACQLVEEPVFKWKPGVAIAASLSGKILMLERPSDPALIGKLKYSGADAIVEIVKHPEEPESNTRLIPVDAGARQGPVIISVPALDVSAVFDRLPLGITKARADLAISAPNEHEVTLRNVIGILPGSDPVLSNQYLILSAHYDHLGVAGFGDIYNGANDNASGVATVIELAFSLARENPRPRRTIVFVCFFGEEKGLLGSAWYVKHPAVPLSQTIADLNFEQMGEPAANEGLPAGSLGITGFAYSDIPRLLAPVLAKSEVTLRDARHNADFFDRSDNLSFAQAGIPSHTLVAALEFPDYHRTTDTSRKLNYANMAKLEGALVPAIMELANRATQPHWSVDSKKAREFLNAWHAMHP